MELHAFADASGIGLGTSIYLVTRGTKAMESHLIFAKSLVKPPKLKQSIPRLELQALLNTAKAIGFVRNQLKIKVNKEQLYTDSKCVVDWLRNKQPKGKYEKTRIKIIREFHVKHIRTDQNPADLTSRGIKPIELINNEFWFKGPKWLHLTDSEKPSPIVEYNPGEELLGSEP